MSDSKLERRLAELERDIDLALDEIRDLKRRLGLNSDPYPVRLDSPLKGVGGNLEKF